MGFQKRAQFQVSLLGQYVNAYTTDCLLELGGTLPVSCDNAPVYANLYFDQIPYFVNGTTENFTGADYAGYVSNGFKYDVGFCVDVVDTENFCTTASTEIFASDYVTQDNWNYVSSAASGTIGLGRNSPVWTILGNPSEMYFDVYMTNFNSWKWADDTYTPITT